MRPNGLCLLVDMAVRELGDPLVSRYRKALVLGALREDVAWVPGIRVVYEHLSLSHFYGPIPGGFVPLLWPGPRSQADRYFARGVAAQRAGRSAEGFVALGRVCHILADMACPVHVHRVAHETDPYEWYVDAHVERLGALPVPDVEPARRPSDLVAQLAQFTRRFPPDRTNNALGYMLRRMGLARAVPRDALAAQAEAIIPLAAGTTVALLRMFLRDTAPAAP